MTVQRGFSREVNTKKNEQKEMNKVHLSSLCTWMGRVTEETQLKRRAEKCSRKRQD